MDGRVADPDAASRCFSNAGRFTVRVRKTTLAGKSLFELEGTVMVCSKMEQMSLTREESNHHRNMETYGGEGD